MGRVPLAAEEALPDVAAVSMSITEGLCQAIEAILVQARVRNTLLKSNTLLIVSSGFVLSSLITRYSLVANPAIHVLQGLGERAMLVRAWRAPLLPWHPASAHPPPAEVYVGIHLRPELCDSLVDRGPAPGDEAVVAAWR